MASPIFITNVVTNVLREVVTNVVEVQQKPKEREMITIRGEDIKGEEFGSSGKGAYRINSDGQINAGSNSYGAPQILVFGPEVSEGEIAADIRAGGGPNWHVGIAMACSRSIDKTGGQQYYNSPCVALMYSPGKVVLAKKLMMGYRSADLVKSLDSSDNVSALRLKLSITKQGLNRRLIILVNDQKLREVEIDSSQANVSGQFVLYMANAGGTFSNVEAKYYK